jgi:hypothetical protein
MWVWNTLLPFAVLMLAVLLVMHRYAWARLVRDTRIAGRARHAALAVLVALALAIPAAFVLGRLRGGGEIAPLAWSAWTWFGVLFYVVLFLAAIDLLVLAARAARLARRPAEVDPARRAFLARTAAGAVVVGAGGVGVAGVRSATGEITTPEVPVRLPRLPAALSGTRVVQLSDVHLGPILDGRFLESVVEKANLQRPDLVVITGDLVDAPVEVLARELEPLARLRARHGVAFVTGNHEYYCGADAWIEWLRRRGVKVLVNERVAVGDAGASFDLAGLTDAHGGRYTPAHAPDVARALAGRDADRELVVLAHQPVQIHDLEGRGAGLVLSGHTHGGQLWPFGALVALAQPYLRGLHTHPDGTQIYVSRGTGFWGPPMRVANPAEITTLVLTA